MTIQLSTPEPELSSLSMCAPTSAALGEWVEQLPIASTLESARALQKATSEAAELKVAPALRIDLLETLRSTVHYLCTRLDRLGRQRAGHPNDHVNLAIRLQSNLVVGYKAAIRDAATAEDTDSLVLACHRALSDASRVLLRSLQGYMAPPRAFWHEANQILKLAEEREFDTKTVHDEENFRHEDLSIVDVYMRSALLTVARPNQLRHAHLNALFNALDAWVGLATLTHDNIDEAQFALDMNADAPPIYRELATFGDDSDPRGIVTEVLVYEIEAYLNEINTTIEIPDFVEPMLLRHVALAWDTMKKRSFTRLPASGTLKTCVGMRSTHYYLSGGVDFANQIGKADMLLRKEINPFAADEQPQRPGDVWDNAHDLSARIPENPNIENPERLVLEHAARARDAPGEYHHYTTQIVDTSPGGYCMRWSDPKPGLLVGDLMGIREHPNARWCIAVIRWLKQDGDDVLTGVELLAPRAIPVAVRGVRTRRNQSDFSRGLLLPAIDAIGQPAMLITPRLAFEESQKVHITRQGIQTTAQLMRGVLSTESFNQFTFRMLDGYLENSHIDMNMDPLEELMGDDSDAPRTKK